MNKETRRSHYVPRKYLANFVNTRGMLQIYDIRQKKTYIQKSKNTCVINDLYAIESKITQNEVELFKRMFSVCNPTSIPEDINFIDKLVSYLNIDMPFTISGLTGNGNPRNSSEELFTRYEALFYPLLDRLTKGDTNFYNDLVEDSEKLHLGYILARDRHIESYLRIEEFDVLSNTIIAAMNIVNAN